MASSSKPQIDLDAHEEGMGFAVEPLSDCPHLDEVNKPC